MLNSFTTIITILILALYLRKNNNTVNYLIAILAYLSLHYAFAVVVTFVTDWAYPNIIFHTVATPMPVKIMGMLFIFVCVALMIFENRKKIIPVIKQNRLIIISFVILLIMFLMVTIFDRSLYAKGGVFYVQSAEIHKAVISSVLMWFLTLLIAVLLVSNKPCLSQYKNHIVYTVMSLLLIELIFCVYEVSTAMAFARSASSAPRAAGTLFNPNILGIWSAFIALGVSYLYYLKYINLRMLSVLLAILSMLYIFTSSRSGLIVCIGSMLAIVVLLRYDNNNNRISFGSRLLPIGILLTSLSIFTAFSKMLVMYFPHNMFVWSVSENSNRIIFLVYDISSYYFRKLLHALDKYQWFQNVSNNVTEFIANNDSGFIARSSKAIMAMKPSAGVDVSVGGRMTGGLSADNTYIFIHALAGLPGTVLWLSLIMLAFWLGIKKYRNTPNLNSVFSLSILICMLISGVIMRSTQLFPMWIFFGILLGVSMSCWMNSSKKPMLQ